MSSAPSQFPRILGVAVLAAACLFSSTLPAQAPQHIVSPADLQQATVDASQQRQKNIETIDRFFSSGQARHALETAHINPQEVKKATASLSDQDLAQLAARATKAQADFAAGNVDNRGLLIIILCIAALILIIVAVH